MLNLKGIQNNKVSLLVDNAFGNLSVTSAFDRMCLVCFYRNIETITIINSYL